MPTIHDIIITGKYRLHAQSEQFIPFEYSNFFIAWKDCLSLRTTIIIVFLSPKNVKNFHSN